MGFLYMGLQVCVDWSGTWARKEAQLCRASPYSQRQFRVLVRDQSTLALILLFGGSSIMIKKLIYLVCLLSVAALAGVAQAETLSPDDTSIKDNLCLWLRAPGTYFNPSTGVWSDLGPRGNDAEPVGNVAAWTIIYVGPTLSSGSNPLVFDNDFSTVKFAADTDDLMRATNLNGGVGPGELTILAVYKVTPTTPSIVRPVGFGSISGEGMNMGNNFNLSVDVSIRKDNGMVGGATVAHPDDQFFIRVARMNSTDIDQWFNSDGTLVQVHAAPGTAYVTSTDNFYLGDLRAGASTTIGGSLAVADIEIAEVVVYNTALSEAQIEGISEWLQANVGVVFGVELGLNPSPPEEATDMPRDVSLGWTPGMYADKHDVYFGTNLNDVNDATATVDPGSVYQGRQDPNCYPIGGTLRLELGQTYYWRVDEVNAPPDNTIFKGNIWSFTTEPVGYPIAGENIAATASSSNTADEGPENTINGSGLDDDDLHSVRGTDMWLSSAVDPNAAWIQYEFDKVYKLYEMLVWNHNTSLELALGFGVKDANIEYSTDGNDWTVLGDFEFARGSGTAGLSANATVDLSGVVAKYVKITTNSNWGGVVPQKGLSEVRFFYIPVNATEPYPDSGATDVVRDVVLGWKAGREAVTHEVQLSTDEQAVIDGSAPVVSVSETSYDTGELQLAQTYYWKVNEVNEAETPTTWESALWSFTTIDHVVVDDFESYNDLDPDDPESNRIFLAWLDGYEVPTNGSLVGYGQSPFTEQSIVHGGKQSMPFFYANTGSAAYSEAELTLSPSQDWTKHGVKTLSLWFFGDASNTAAQMYVKVNGTKVAYDGNPGNLALAGWQVWNIDLASLGVDLQNVTKLGIGIDGNDASGTLYFDDIRLYRLAPQQQPN
jgi:hypothetical protein